MLPVLAYFMYLGGDESQMNAIGQRLGRPGADRIPVRGREAYIDGVCSAAWAWMEKQIRRVEQSCFGGTRPQVEEYLQGIVLRAGAERTVGQEEAFAVPQR